MTKNQVNDLTPEEQAQAPAGLLEAIESGSVAAGAWLASWRHRRSIGEEATAQAEEIKQEVAAASQEPEQGNLAQWCGFPTDMTRCSPFFPMNPNELGERRFFKDYLITSANWGEITYSGVQLSTYEEDALLALLAIVEQKNSNLKTSYFVDYCTGIGEVEVVDEPRPVWVGFENDEDTLPKTLTYKGPLLPLLHILYGNRVPSKKDYKRLINSLEIMTFAALKISISSGKTKSGKKRNPRISQMSAILADVKWDDNKKELTATINPFFYETYMSGRVTLMDVTKRMGIKGVIAKSLYRFVQSQRENPVFAGHFLTLADALNMDREQLPKQLRRQLKTAIGELIRQGILMKKSGFVDTDILRLERTPEALPKTGKKMLKNT